MSLQKEYPYRVPTKTWARYWLVYYDAYSGSKKKGWVLYLPYQISVPGSTEKVEYRVLGMISDSDAIRARDSAIELDLGPLNGQKCKVCDNLLYKHPDSGLIQCMEWVCCFNR